MPDTLTESIKNFQGDSANVLAAVQLLIDENIKNQNYEAASTILLDLCQLLAQDGIMDKAMEACKRSAAVNPKNHRASNLLGEIYYKWGEEYDRLSKQKYNDAIRAFFEALSVDYDFQSYLTPIKKTASKIMPTWHFAMLNDVERNIKFSQAINIAVQSFDEPPIVVDIGAGSGLLSLIAAQSGAKHVYSVEEIPALSYIAESIVAENRYTEKITIISKNSNDIVLGYDVPERPKVVIAEIFDSGLLGEGLKQTIRQLKKSGFIDYDTVLIPSAAKVYAQVLDSPTHFTHNIVENVAGFDLQNFNVFYTMNLGYTYTQLQDLSYTEVTDRQEVLQFDFINLEEIGESTVKFNVRNKGIYENMVVAFWFQLFLDKAHTIVIDSAPEYRTHWGQAIQYLGNEWKGSKFNVSSDILELAVKHSANKIYYEMHEPSTQRFRSDRELDEMDFDEIL